MKYIKASLSNGVELRIFWYSEHPSRQWTGILKIFVYKKTLTAFFFIGKTRYTFWNFFVTFINRSNMCFPQMTLRFPVLLTLPPYIFFYNATHKYSVPCTLWQIVQRWTKLHHSASQWITLEHNTPHFIKLKHTESYCTTLTHTESNCIAPPYIAPYCTQLLFSLPEWS